MRIYNGTSRQMDLPLSTKQRISIAPKAVSGDILANSELLSLLVTSYSTDEVALIISGPFELKVASTMPTVVNYVVQSIEEAILRFNPPTPETKPSPEPEVENNTTEPKAEEVVETGEDGGIEAEPETDGEKSEEPKPEKKAGKKKGGKKGKKVENEGEE